MRGVYKFTWLISIFVLIFSGIIVAKQPIKGKLFIIGGGERSSALIGTMVTAADLREDDYIVVLPMATSIPEESVAYISEQLREHTQHAIHAYNFTRAQAENQKSWIDSVKNARLIYITGGDQNKFMDVVRGTPLFDALHFAYAQGATIAGTSAGAAIMSEVMITGEQIISETGGFREIRSNYVKSNSGMGFLKEVIIDQHFIMRSRYNRLLSILADHPRYQTIGIDEATAILVNGRRAKVVGDSQVILVQKPKSLRVNQSKKVSFKNAKLSIYSEGQEFKINR